MVGHDNVSTDEPRLGVRADVSKGVVHVWMSEPRPAIFRADGEKDDGRFRCGGDETVYWMLTLRERSRVAVAHAMWVVSGGRGSRRAEPFENPARREPRPPKNSRPHPAS